ncbi:MAG: four helix bundle protein [Prevotella sp.]|nr:four helix bundle protein [Prevotella sp.]
MLKRPENVILQKTEDFSDRIVRMYKYLLRKKEGNSDLLKQVLRSGTSVGANTAESQYAQSKADFLTKLTIALKEANETKFWLARLYAAEHLSETEYNSIINDNVEIIKLLTSITKTVKRNQQE